jgi:hypothetical protein
VKNIHAHAVAEKALEVFDYMNLVGKAGPGKVRQGVRFSRILADDRRVLLEIDKDHLPPGVTLVAMKGERVVKELIAQIERPVEILNTVGVSYVIDTQVPKSLPSNVVLTRDMIPSGLPYPVPIGFDSSGMHWESLLSTYHILVGGMTRYGKSTWLNAMLFALLSACSPDELDLILIDNKVVEFACFTGAPHLHGRQVAMSQEAGLVLLRQAMEEVERRKRLFVQEGARNLSEYNEMPAVVEVPLMLIVIDEIVDLLMSAEDRDEIEHIITRIGQIGAGFGVILCIATQKPRFDIISTLITGNFDTRVGFRCRSWQASKMIIDAKGLETLPKNVPGRMMTTYGGMLRTMQGLWLPTTEVRRLCEHLRGGPMPAIEVETPSALSALDRDVAMYCRDELGGYFSVRTVWGAFSGKASHGGIVQMGKKWERRGWLEQQAGSNKRRLTIDILAELEK